MGGEDQQEFQQRRHGGVIGVLPVWDTRHLPLSVGQLCDRREGGTEHCSAAV